MRFYPGLSYFDLLNMPARVVENLWTAIDAIEAQEFLVNYKLSLVPYMKEKDRADLHKNLYGQAYPSHIYKRDSKDVGFLLNKLGGR